MIVTIFLLTEMKKNEKIRKYRFNKTDLLVSLRKYMFCLIDVQLKKLSTLRIKVSTFVRYTFFLSEYIHPRSDDIHILGALLMRNLRQGNILKIEERVFKCAFKIFEVEKVSRNNFVND